MTKLKLDSVVDDKPIRLTVALPAATHRELVANAQVLARETGAIAEPVKLIGPMLARFMATDRFLLRLKPSLTRSLLRNPGPLPSKADQAPQGRIVVVRSPNRAER